MNGTTSTAIHRPPSRSSTRARYANIRDQLTHTHVRSRPAIDTSVPNSYSYVYSSPLAGTTSYSTELQDRLATTSSVMSSSSSNTNASLFSRPEGTVATPLSTTSAGSLAPSTTTSKGYKDVLLENKDKQEVNTGVGMLQRAFSPTESLDSIGDHLHSHVLALHDFTPIAPNATCLSFRAGQIIQVLNRDTSGWWDGELEGRRGWFPSNYVSGLDQVGRLKDEVLVELHGHSRQESTPSLASWTSGLSHSSSILQSGTLSIQTAVTPNTQNFSEPVLAESVPGFGATNSDVLHPSSPSRGYKTFQKQSSLVRHDNSRQEIVERSGGLSPTFSIYRAIAEGELASRALSPTPSFAASHHGQHSPLLSPLLHALSLLHRAVAARHQGHYQPSTACVISCVRSLLTSTECLHRDAPALRRVPQLAQERKVILGNLGTLVSQARRCSEWPAMEADEMWDGTAVREAEVEQQDWELEQMLRMGGEVLRNVTQFLEVCEQNGIDLPVPRRSPAHSQGSGSSGSEREMEKRMRIDLGMATTTPLPTPHRRVQSGSNSMLRAGSARGVSRTDTNGSGPSPLTSSEQSTTATRLRTKSLNDLRERRRMEQAGRAREMASNAVPMPLVHENERGDVARPQLRLVAHRQIHRPQLSVGSTSSLSSGSIESYSSPVTPSFPSGPCTTAQILSALRATHDDLLSTIAAFIGHVHSHGRDAHASSKGHLIELTRETMDMVHQLLTLVEAVAHHPDVGINKVEALQRAKDSLFSATNALVEAVRELTGPASTASEEEERRKTLNGATGVLKVAADCVAAVKVCLSRPIGEEPFVICLPSLPSAESVPSLVGPTGYLGKRQRPVSYLRSRTISISSLQGSGQHNLSQEPHGIATDASESHLDEDETVQPTHAHTKPPTTITMEASSRRSGGYGGTQLEDSDNDEPSGSSPSEESNEERMREPLLRKDSQSTFETKLLHGDLPVPPSRSADSVVPPTPISPNQSPTSLDVDSVFAKVLAHEYDVRDIAYNQEGAIVGATLEVMVEKLTPHDVLVDPVFHQIFMMTWRLFVSPSELVNALLGRYHLQPPLLNKDEDQELWIRRKATPVKLRVFNLVKSWLENYWRAETDDAVLTQLSQFVRSVMALQFPGPAQRILELIRARTLSDDSIVSPRPIDRIKSVDRLREGSPLPLTPVSPSDIPRPTINKALFTALKNRSFTNIAITDFDALELARQFTIMESKLYLRVQPDEVLELGQAGVAPAVNVKAISTLSTAITGWVTESILNESDSKKRTNLVKFFIKVADRCSSLNNYSTSRSFLAALDSSTISRLHQTWTALPQKSKTQLEALRKVADHTRNYSEYRARLRNTTAPAVPFLGLYLTDVTFCREGNPSYRASPRDPDRKLINFNKYHKLARIVQDMQRFQIPYNLKEITEVQQYLMAQFDNAKNAGDLQDLYRRSLLVEPRRAADAPSGDTKPVLQIFGLGTLSRNQNISQPLKTVINA